MCGVTRMGRPAIPMTAEAAGGPHAAPVFFAADAALQLVFFSGPASLHVRHALADPRVSAAIYPDVADWTQIHGLQLDGALRRIPPAPDWDRAWGIYLRKFPFAAELRAIVERSSLLIFVPTWVRLVDNRRGFGFRREWRRVA